MTEPTRSQGQHPLARANARPSRRPIRVAVVYNVDYEDSSPDGDPGYAARADVGVVAQSIAAELADGTHEAHLVPVDGDLAAMRPLAEASAAAALEAGQTDTRLDRVTEDASAAQAVALDSDRRLRALQRASTTADDRDTTLGSWRFGSGGRSRPAVRARVAVADACRRCTCRRRRDADRCRRWRSSPSAAPYPRCLIRGGWRDRLASRP